MLVIDVCDLDWVIDSRKDFFIIWGIFVMRMFLNNFGVVL